MNKLFSPIGEDWERTWHPYRWRMEVDDFGLWSKAFNNPDAIEEDLQRCYEIGDYFDKIRRDFTTYEVMNKFQPYNSGGKAYKKFSQILSDAVFLYETEVGKPNNILLEFLSNKSKLLKCIQYYKSHTDLLIIGYFNYSGFIELPSLYNPYSDKLDLRDYKYPFYRLDGALKVANWVKDLKAKGVDVRDIKYCQYHGDSYFGEYLVKDYIRSSHKLFISDYREECRRHNTLMQAFVTV